MCKQFSITDWLEIDGKWHHIVFVIDQEKGEYYAFVDGVKQAIDPTRMKEFEGFAQNLFIEVGTVCSGE